MSKNFEFILGENEISRVVEILPKSGTIILQGNLASGKTTLVREIVKKHGKNWKNVSSPTFSIMQNYGEIYHYDIYNAGINGILENGLFENFFAPGLHLIEWGDENLIKYLQNFGLEFCIVQISIKGEKRKYEVKNA